MKDLFLKNLHLLEEFLLLFLVFWCFGLIFTIELLNLLVYSFQVDLVELVDTHVRVIEQVKLKTLFEIIRKRNFKIKLHSAIKVEHLVAQDLVVGRVGN